MVRGGDAPGPSRIPSTSVSFSLHTLERLLHGIREWDLFEDPVGQLKDPLVQRAPLPLRLRGLRLGDAVVRRVVWRHGKRPLPDRRSAHPTHNRYLGTGGRGLQPRPDESVDHTDVKLPAATLDSHRDIGPVAAHDEIDLGVSVVQSFHLEPAQIGRESRMT